MHQNQQVGNNMGRLKALFTPQYTLTIHLVQLTLIILVFILAIVRVSLNDAPLTRANIMFIPIVRPAHHSPTEASS